MAHLVHHGIMVVQFFECLETPNLHCDFAALTENALHTGDTHSLEGEKAANSHRNMLNKYKMVRFSAALCLQGYGMVPSL